MAKYEKVRKTQNLPAAGAAGASRALLELPNVVTGAMSELANIEGMASRALSGVLGLPTTPQPPYARHTPASNIAATAGIGTYQPQTPGEETAAFAGEMAGSTIVPGMVAHRVAGPVASGLEALSGLTSFIGGEATEQMGYGRTPGVIGGSFVPGMAATTTQRAMLPRGRQTAQRRVAASERTGVPISGGQAVGGSYLEKMTESLPGGYQAKHAFRERQSDEMRRALEEITAGRAGALEPDVMRSGQVITQGIEDWSQRFRSEANRLYRMVQTAVPPATVTDPSSLRRTITTLQGEGGAFSGVFKRPVVERIANRLQELDDAGAEISYRDLERFRSDIGAEMSTPSIIAEAPRAQLNQLYGAISDDMQRTLGHVGGPGAVADWERATGHWREGMQRIDDILAPIERRNTPEDVYKAATSGIRSGSTRVEALRDTLDPEQWDLFRRTAASELGRGPGSQAGFEGTLEAISEFNPERFLTNLGNYSDPARALMFGDMPGMTDLADIATGMRRHERYLWNPSGTASKLTVGGIPAFLTGQSYGASGLSGAAETAAAVGTAGLGMYGLQRALQSPTGVRALTQPVPMAGRGVLGVAPRVAATGSQEQLPSGQTVERVPEPVSGWGDRRITRDTQDRYQIHSADDAAFAAAPSGATIVDENGTEWIKP